MLPVSTDIINHFFISAFHDFIMHETFNRHGPGWKRWIDNMFHCTGIQYILIVGFMSFPMTKRFKLKFAGRKNIPAFAFGIKYARQWEIERAYAVYVSIGNVVISGRGGVIFCFFHITMKMAGMCFMGSISVHFALMA